MAALTQAQAIVQAQAHLDAWLAADLAVATTGKSATVGGISVTRSDAAEIARQIAYWTAEVSRLTAGRTGGVRLLRAVPRDF